MEDVKNTNENTAYAIPSAQNFMLEISPNPDKDSTSLYHKLHQQCLQKKPAGENDRRVRRVKTRNREHQCASKIGKTFATSREKKEKKGDIMLLASLDLSLAQS